MKNLFILAVVVSLATVIFSCSKDGSIIVKSSPAQGPNGPGGDGSPANGSGDQARTCFASDWFSVEFQPSTDPGIIGLVGETAIELAAPANFATEVKLVYARYTGREFIYSKLPLVLQTTLGDIELSAGFTDRSVVFVLTNSNGMMSLSDAKYFENYQYRYISMPVELFSSLNNIDWSDYEQVANELKFPL
jgi:hypothetical protein